MKAIVFANENTIKIHTSKYDKYINSRIKTLYGARWTGSCWEVDRFQNKGDFCEKDQLEMIKNHHLSPNNPNYIELSINE